MSQKWKLIKIDIFSLEWKDDEVKMNICLAPSVI